MEFDRYDEKNRYFNRFTRGLFFLAGDSVALMLSAAVAFTILYPFSPTPRDIPLDYVLVMIVSILTGLSFFRMYVVSWRFLSLRELVRIFGGIAFGGFAGLMLSEGFLSIGSFEYGMTTLMMINALIFVGGFRISKRIFVEVVGAQRNRQIHTVIFGGESEGEQILRDILKNNHWKMDVRGIFDDRVMPGILLHGRRILGGKEKMFEYLKTYDVDQLIVAFPEIPKKELKEIVDKVKKIRPKMDVKILPAFHSLGDEPVGVKHIRDISIEDILGREPVDIDIDTIQKSIKGKTVLVTGAGGSIGSELVRQCVKLKPANLVMLDVDETELFHVENELKKFGSTIIPCVANVTDMGKMERVIREYQPDVIFHAAAYKHVPMMESFPDEAVRVNVGGTRILATLACKYGVEKFVMVSTDKAVNPTNVMGATKRAAEEICMSYNGTCKTQFISVRFGNVLGSRGSVVPIFMEQISESGPITITDERMKRYFMTIPEAVLLVMEAGSMGSGGEVFVLDMGEPVKIIDMAKDLIRLHGLEPYKDIQIEVTGMRPGEKLFEELLNAEEGVEETEHKEIFKAICSRKQQKHKLDEQIELIYDHITNGDHQAIREVLGMIVPTYVYKKEKEKEDSPISENGVNGTKETHQNGIKRKRIAEETKPTHSHHLLS